MHSYKYAISIIVPVYNPDEKLFENMLSSIAAQTLEDYELILVDDGSSEESRAYITETVAKFSKARVLNQENSGVSSARNRGLSEANGKYITFIDEDDYIAPEFLQLTYNLAEKYVADVVYGDIQRTSHIDEKYTKSGSEEKFVENSEIEYAKMSLLGCVSEQVPYLISGSPCGNLYKRELFENEQLRFDRDVKYFEDQLFNRRVLLYAKGVVVCPERWYFYYNNDGSAMHAIKKDEQVLDNVNNLLDGFAEVNRNESHKVNNCYLIYLVHLFLGILSLVYIKTGRDLKETTKVMKIIINRPEYREIVTKRPEEMTKKDRTMRLMIKSKQIWIPVTILRIMGRI